MNREFERKAAFGFGLVFLIAILTTAIYFPSPTSYQYTVFRIVLALSAGGVATVIPGLIELKILDAIPKVALRAGGAMAVFSIVYFFSPAALQNIIAIDNVEPHTRRSDLMFKSVFGEKPNQADTPVLQGAKLGGEIPYLDFETKNKFSDVFFNRNLKVVIPFYIESPCKKDLLESLIFSESTSAFLSRPVDLIIVNVEESPSQSEYLKFKSEWNLPENFYFFTAPLDERKKLTKVFSIHIEDYFDSSGKRTVNYANSAFVFLPGGKPGWVVELDDDLLVIRKILYYLAEVEPSLLNRKLLSDYVPQTSFKFIPDAHASAQVSLLQQKVAEISERRKKTTPEIGDALECDHHE